MTDSNINSTPANGVRSPAADNPSEDIRHLISQAFVPHIAVHTSDDTDAITTEKGFKQGLWQLLRPYGDRVQGKITIRDSVGASRSCEDFGVRFVRLKPATLSAEQHTAPNTPAGTSGEQDARRSADGIGEPSNQGVDSRLPSQNATVSSVEALIKEQLGARKHSPANGKEREKSYTNNAFSQLYATYSKRLVAELPPVPHESFAHPVACVIAISSRSPNPIDALRKLYDESTRGDHRLPVWMNQDYLRYYVLVHDEEKDDISKSTVLFEQMKRHYGLHCHLLRIRSSHCIITDDDAIPFPISNWLSASEALEQMRDDDSREDQDSPRQCLYESDSTAIKTFVREMVTQSVIPSMERCISIWNDQIASRRRGLSGKFMSLSKRWTGFGGGSRSVSPATSTAPTANGNYDAAQGFYRPESPEALLRKLSDFSFMLRDWKLAQSTYEFCRSDYNNDKAWHYHAAASEMSAISSLLATQAMNAKARIETIDQMLENATYSYVTRCSDSYGVVRCLQLSMELLKLRSGSMKDDAARYGAKLIELKVLGPAGDALIKERIASCYASHDGVGSGKWGARARKAALWNVLAADSWLGQDKPAQARLRLQEVRDLYGRLPSRGLSKDFLDADQFLCTLENQAAVPGLPIRGDKQFNQLNQSSPIEESSEIMGPNTNRRSYTGRGISTMSGSALVHGMSTGADEFTEQK